MLAANADGISFAGGKDDKAEGLSEALIADSARGRLKRERDDVVKGNLRWEHALHCSAFESIHAVHERHANVVKKG